MEVLTKSRNILHYIGKCNDCGCQFKINEYEYQDSAVIDIYGYSYFRCPNCNHFAELNEMEE